MDGALAHVSLEADGEAAAAEPVQKRARGSAAEHDADDEVLEVTAPSSRTRGPQLMRSQGVFLIPAVLTGDALAGVCRQAGEQIGEVLRLFCARGALQQLGQGQFREIDCRDGNRVDICLRAEEEPLRSLATQGVWMPAVRAILGEDVTLLRSGAVVATGAKEGSHVEDQAWHQDGGHLFPDADLPCHCLNVFVPLVDVSEENGPTQFILGSHRSSFGQDGGEIEATAVSMPCAAGSALLFDYRVFHRGAGNSTPEDRPCLYFVYAKPWFRDHKNNRATRSLLDPPLA